MSELANECVVKKREQKIETCNAGERIAGFAIAATVVTVLAFLVAVKTKDYIFHPYQKR